ncbi:MAG: acyl-homoserine-lactone synthase [Paracoccaceae bacterium]
MFKDRAEQFKARHGWAVTVNNDDHEIDEYDALNPLYAIWEPPEGTHGGSIRILPTVGKTMFKDHFIGLADMKAISPVIWECTRFCISPRLKSDQSKIAASLILAGCELGVRFGLESSIGVVYTHTLPIYRRIGWIPDVIGSSGKGRKEISACRWPINAEVKANIYRKFRIAPELLEYWFDQSFNDTKITPVALAA